MKCLICGSKETGGAFTSYLCGPCWNVSSHRIPDLDEFNKRHGTEVRRSHYEELKMDAEREDDVWPWDDLYFS